jgi:radical SAM superfamily enzyme YgiQ (UPF0313 family)
MTLSSVLKGKGHEVQLLLSEELGENEIIRKVKIYKPHILAYSIMTGEHSYHIELNKMVRTHYNDALSVFGGPHPTYSPGMIHKEYVDAICRGEGEIYFPQLIEKYSKNEDYFNTPNFWFKKKDGSIITNELGDLVEDLDKLPNPDRKLMYDADTQLRARGSKLFMSNRGCPYKCTYCFNHAYNKMTKGHGDMMRYRSVDSVISPWPLVILL